LAADPDRNPAKENGMPSAPFRYVFKDERTRPAQDLLSRIPAFAPRRVADLGCGPGFSTELIARLFPHAEIVGVEHSEKALQTARTRLPGIQFETLDIGHWSPAEPYDLIFSNGALQWLPNHRHLVPKLLSSVTKGGFLALQIPNNLQEPNRALMRMVAADGPWAQKLLPIAKSEPNNEAYEDLYSALRPICASMEIWETTYFYPLNGVWSIVAWMKASGLDPFLAALDTHERRGFLRHYADELAREYPVQPDGKVLLRFPRLFIVAQR
jgi:trans-aconitate 2-methyltransferase